MVVPYKDALSEAPDVDACAKICELHTARRRHGYVVINDRSVRDRPLCKLTICTYADSVRVRPLAINHIVGNDKGTNAYNANRFCSCLCSKGASCNLISLHVSAPAKSAYVDPRSIDIVYCVSGNV